MERFSRLAPTAETSVDSASRAVSYVFSDESVGRDGHVIKADAWQTENFLRNPVFCWHHSDDVPPIGRVFDLHTSGRTLRGSVRYAETEFATMIYELVRGGFLNATSTSWKPITADRMPDGTGLIFTKVDLLEISQVSVPALPSALATARSAGVDVAPMLRWAEIRLDKGRGLGIERGELLALRRAAAGRMTAYSLPTTGAGQRAALAKQLQEKGERQAIALILRARGDSKLPAASRAALDEVQGHHERCARVAGELGRRHERIATGVSELASIHRQLARAIRGTAAAKDPEIREAVASLERCSRSLDSDHDGCTTACEDLGVALGAAKAGVQNVVDGIAELDEA